MTCEDYPCCGHTDGLGCDWVYTPEQQQYDMDHSWCEHSAGHCAVADALDYEDDDADEEVGAAW